MSWSISCGGKRDEALSRIKEQSAALTYLVGPENELKEKLVATAVAVVEANKPETTFIISMGGSATSYAGSEQRTQAVYLNISPSI